MKVELHLHTSRYSACAVVAPQQAIRGLIATGYDAVYITEHDAVWPEWEIAELQEMFPAIRIFPGVELSLRPTGLQHLLVLGTSDPEYLAISYAPGEVLAKARREGHLTVLAHPFRWEGGDQLLHADSPPDALEYHTGNQNAKEARASLAASDLLNLPLVNAGDVHAMDVIGQFWIETTRPIERAGDIRQIVLEGAYRNCREDT